MKTKRTFLSILTLCIALLFTACSGKEAASTEKSQDTKTESSSVSTDDSNSKLDNLYQQENQIFADHEDVWNKAFGMMSKSAADPNGNYADYLADTVESNKDSFTDDELKTLTADIETIRKIEEQIAELLRIPDRHTSAHKRTEYQWYNQHLHQFDKALSDHVQYTFYDNVVFDMSTWNRIT